MNIYTTILALVFFVGDAAASDATEHWEAYSRTAVGITGDIDLSRSEIVFANGERLRISYVGTARGVVLAPNLSDEITEVFRVDNPRDVPLLSGNVLCGAGRLPTFMTVLEQADGAASQARTLFVTFINGDGAPTSGLDDRRLCASFTFKQYGDRSSRRSP